ncbi:hypothetical protein FGO68_gene6434 [Halteria grandinella]|uniref:Uncharacterized protein n=1 Tax=Halteria grandinella TaxID=5974 RepID=A0A8J8T057_HALGN|nr:hypothetical protein FGO68_gene6434 [Halteria grandinella]
MALGRAESPKAGGPLALDLLTLPEDKPEEILDVLRLHPLSSGKTPKAQPNHGGLNQLEELIDLGRRKDQFLLLLGEASKVGGLKHSERQASVMEDPRVNILGELKLPEHQLEGDLFVVPAGEVICKSCHQALLLIFVELEGPWHAALEAILPIHLDLGLQNARSLVECVHHESLPVGGGPSPWLGPLSAPSGAGTSASGTLEPELQVEEGAILGESERRRRGERDGPSKALVHLLIELEVQDFLDSVTELDAQISCHVIVNFLTECD